MVGILKMNKQNIVESLTSFQIFVCTVWGVRFQIKIAELQLHTCFNLFDISEVLTSVFTLVCLREEMMAALLW